MKSFLSSFGWILFLALAVFFLLFYNLAYLPRADRIVRQQNEINMWIGQLQEMSDSLRMVRTQWDTAFSVSLSFEELFGGAQDLKVAPSAESLLRAYIPTLQGSTGVIDVVGHAGGNQVPQAVRDRYQSSWDYAAAGAGAVARRLAAWGVAADRIRVASFSDEPCAGASAAPDSRTGTPRVDIVVRNQ
jgi:flagellar motor protein MotB